MILIVKPTSTSFLRSFRKAPDRNVECTAGLLASVLTWNTNHHCRSQVPLLKCADVCRPLFAAWDGGALFGSCSPCRAPVLTCVISFSPDSPQSCTILPTGNRTNQFTAVPCYLRCRGAWGFPFFSFFFARIDCG